MTAYQGGKKRICKRIHQVIDRIESEITGDDKLPYFEPFCGMCSVLQQFAAENDRDISACDAHPDLMLMWKAVQDGWKPPRKCSKKRYLELEESDPSPERAFIGFAASYGGNFFQNYRLNLSSKRDYLRESYNGVMNVAKDIADVSFLDASEYSKFTPKDMLIYCDPPYDGNNLGTSLFTEFDHEKFWNVMRTWSRDNIVIISEWRAPKDFKKVWSTGSHVNNQTTTTRYTDCLFVHNNIYDALSDEAIRDLKKY